MQDFIIRWLGFCEHCGETSIKVYTENGDECLLYEGDLIECTSCGNTGKVVCYDNIASACWEGRNIKLIPKQKEFRLCVLESPFAGDVEGNVEYAQKCMRDMLSRGEAPYASHLLYTQPNVLNDNIPDERDCGIYAGFSWKHLKGVHTVFYIDRGISGGMQLALDYCKMHNMSYEIRHLGYNHGAKFDQWEDGKYKSRTGL